MTAIGLQDSAATFVIAEPGKHAWMNVGYAGFVGCVSGMNDQKISLGMMGCRGVRSYDGVPMATLMRRGLEECDSLPQLENLWKNSPRTCKYDYVFADGKIPQALAVAATPQRIDFIQPGQDDEVLGRGINNAVFISAGPRLTALRQRIADNFGKIDAAKAQWMMTRPVAGPHNLHDVLFVPQDLICYVANADRRHPAADQPYVKFDLTQWLKTIAEQKDQP